MQTMETLQDMSSHSAEILCHCLSMNLKAAAEDEKEEEGWKISEHWKKKGLPKLQDPTHMCQTHPAMTQVNTAQSCIVSVYLGGISKT